MCFSVNEEWHTEVELSMSNIGSPERVDQVKPLKHSGGRPMIPSDVFCKRTRWCVLYSGGKNVKWKDSRVTNERKIWPIHLELKKGKYDEICNSLQSHKGTSGHLTFRGNFWKWMNRPTKLKRSTLKLNQETGWKQWAVLKVLPMYRQALANIMKCLHLKST